MSTNNFSFENILVVLPSFNYDYKKPCQCCGDEACEFSELDSEFDDVLYKEWVKDVQADLQKIDFVNCDKWGGDRNYSGTIIARW